AHPRTSREARAGVQADAGADGSARQAGAVRVDNPFVLIRGATKRRERYFSNYWGDYETREVTVALGLATDNAPPTLFGFRPRREIFAPEASYEIHAHEVSFAELEAFLAANTEFSVTRPSFVPESASERARLPAINVP